MSEPARPWRCTWDFFSGGVRIKRPKAPLFEDFATEAEARTHADRLRTAASQAQASMVVSVTKRVVA